MSVFSHLAVVWVAAAVSARVLAQDVQAVRGIYESNAEAIRSGFQPKFEALQQQYVKSLDALKASAQGRGDFEKTRAAVAELERFSKTKCLPAEPDDRVAPEVKGLQFAYVGQYSKLDADMTAQLGALTVKYVQALDRRLKELTKAGNLRDGAAVQEELARAQGLVKSYAEALAAIKGATPSAAASEGAHPGAPPGAGASWKAGPRRDLYLVIDLSGGRAAPKCPVSYLADAPKGGWPDAYKTEKLVLRRIEPGAFMMGSPEDEPGRTGDEARHRVKLPGAFYIGVFEVTQRQWKLVTEGSPSYFTGPLLPVETVSYNDIRGASAGARWPEDGSVDASSFLGVLRAKSGLAALDLPTESQWECACRAGTETPFGGALDEMAWYPVNSGGTTHPVGLRLPNTWGLYDMHGNVWEWCLDWKGEYSGGSASDVKGAKTGAERVKRGGSWIHAASYCRSAYRGGGGPDLRRDNSGLRVVLNVQAK